MYKCLNLECLFEFKYRSNFNEFLFEYLLSLLQI